MSEKIDQTGKIYGWLTVLSKAADIPSKNPKAKKQFNEAWLCRCQCGKEKIVRSETLWNKRSTPSCGCRLRMPEDVIKIGQKINRLTAVSYAGNGKWNFDCECGGKLTQETNKITSGNTKSCGCLHDENSKIQAKHLVSAKNK
jgi:hypothetical protein